MEILKKAVHIVDKVGEYSGKAGALLIPIIAIIQFAEVILRYVFSSPTSWSWELCAYLYGANFILASAWVLRDGGHVRTDVLFDKLNERQRAVLDICTFSTLFLGFFSIMTWKYIEHAIYSVGLREESYTMWGAPIYYLKIVVAYAFFILLLQGICKIIRDVVFLAKGERI